MKRSGFLAIAVLAAPLVHAVSWTDLWARPEQQSYAERRAGYDAIQAQQYAAAAKRLEPYQDPVSQYDRGNALARAGDLQAALSAYDAALKTAPPDSNLHRDAQHNRDLVQKQLQGGQDKQSRDSKDGKNSPDSKDSKDAKKSQDSKDAGKSADSKDTQSASQGQAGDQKGDQRQDQKSGQSPAAPRGSEPPSPPPGGAASSAEAAQAQKEKERAEAELAASAAQAAKAPQAAKQAQSANDAQNQHDTPAASAAEAFARADERPAASAANGESPPPSEQALSLDQWLRWIPDDPSGLLRRKFMIEHMLKQREGDR